MATALKVNAYGIIIAHNHPNGVIKPSRDDIKATKDFKKTVEFFGFSLVDHLIVSTRRNGYFSFDDHGLL